MPDQAIRIDKWLWHARFFKSRTLASALCAGGKVRLDGAAVAKAHTPVRPGQVLTFVQGRYVRVIKVLAIGARRGPASEAQALYEDLSPPVPETAMPKPGAGVGGRDRGAGRPTKKQRRVTDRLIGQEGGTGVPTAHARAGKPPVPEW